MVLPQSATAHKQPAYQSIRLEHVAPEAKEVRIIGDFSGWAKEGIRFSPAGEGVWEATLKLAPGEYQYRLLVDGRWQDHPGARRRMPNPFGSQNCVLVVQETRANR